MAPGAHVTCLPPSPGSVSALSQLDARAQERSRCHPKSASLNCEQQGPALDPGVTLALEKRQCEVSDDQEGRASPRRAPSSFYVY